MSNEPYPSAHEEAQHPSIKALMDHLNDRFNNGNDDEDRAQAAIAKGGARLGAFVIRDTLSSSHAGFDNERMVLEPPLVVSDGSDGMSSSVNLMAPLSESRLHVLRALRLDSEGLISGAKDAFYIYIEYPLSLKRKDVEIFINDNSITKRAVEKRQSMEDELGEAFEQLLSGEDVPENKSRRTGEDAEAEAKRLLNNIIPMDSRAFSIS